MPIIACHPSYIDPRLEEVLELFSKGYNTNVFSTNDFDAWVTYMALRDLLHHQGNTGYFHGTKSTLNLAELEENIISYNQTFEQTEFVL